MRLQFKRKLAQRTIATYQTVYNDLVRSMFGTAEARCPALDPCTTTCWNLKHVKGVANLKLGSLP